MTPVAAELTLTMTHDELVLEALAYRRNVGATLGEIRSYLQFREAIQYSQSQDHAALCRLETAGLLVSVGKRWFFTSAGYKLAKGRSLEPEWASSDAWILLATLYNRGSEQIALAHIIAAADFINHAVPTLEELHGAINRLLATGLLKTKRESFSIPEKALKLFAKVESSCTKRVLDQYEGLFQVMRCPCCGVKLKKVRWQFMLDATAFENAVDAYHCMGR